MSWTRCFFVAAELCPFDEHAERLGPAVGFGGST